MRYFFLAKDDFHFSPVVLHLQGTPVPSKKFRFRILWNPPSSDVEFDADSKFLVKSRKERSFHQVKPILLQNANRRLIPVVGVRRSSNDTTKSKKHLVMCGITFPIRIMQKSDSKSSFKSFQDQILKKSAKKQIFGTF